MTRRIVPALLAFLALVLTAAAIPLAARAVSHDRAAFVSDTIATAEAVASVAEERLADGSADPELPRMIARAAGNNEQIWVLNARGQVISGHASLPAGGPSLVAAARNQSGPLTQVTSAAVTAVIPIRDAGQVSGPVVGTVLLTRSTAPLNGGIRSLWLSLAAIAAVALLAAALLALGFARWVSQPLARLDEAATLLANGDLSVRPEVESGPPEVRRLAGSVAVMAARLDALVQEHRSMLADVSHQLRTPLAALRLRVDLVADGAPDPVAAEMTGVQEEIARLSHLLDGLLAVARAEAVTQVRERVDVAAVAAERVAAWQPVGAERSIALDMVRECSHAVASLVPGHLEQVLDNLIDNALDAAAARITVRVTADAGSVLVRVADDGPGMTEAERERAFRRFTTSSPGGTGIGLAIVHRLIRANGGSAELSRTSGGGLTVTLRFPIV
jgi:signal transduction histidine kinase